MASKSKPVKAVSIDNIYRLDGRVPIAKAIPFGLQHVLAMFVSNLAPITIIAAAAQPALSTEQTGMLLQNAMFIAGIATMIQLYPIWRIGSRLPIVMGVRPLCKAPCPLYKTHRVGFGRHRYRSLPVHGRHPLLRRRLRR